MPVFDFKEKAKEETKAAEAAVTYTLSTECPHEATPENPILVLENGDLARSRHTEGTFSNPAVRTEFAFADGGRADIKVLDARFTALLKWLGENRIRVRLTGESADDGYRVYKIREIAAAGGGKLSAEDGFLQYMIERLIASDAPAEAAGEDDAEKGDDMRLTSIASITDFLHCAGSTLPEEIRLWALRNLAVARSNEVTGEERRHAQRALSIMLNIRWKESRFPAVDPEEARRILDSELYGLDAVKQRIIETIIQINRTHTLPAYGILIAGPAGTGKSQIAYAVARILGLPWTTLDMSSITDPEQLTGSPRIYANAKPGIILEAFSAAEQSNLVFIINELDKASSGKGSGNPADVLLTLLDNLGFTDNYIECTIPTGGVYPIATANDLSAISAPLLSRFAVIEIPDYSTEEKAEIFSEYVLPKVLGRMHMKPEECRFTKDAVERIAGHFAEGSGIRGIEQAAEHLAAHALYVIEAEGAKSVLYEAEDAMAVLGY